MATKAAAKAEKQAAAKAADANERRDLVERAKAMKINVVGKSLDHLRKEVAGAEKAAEKAAQRQAAVEAAVAQDDLGAQAADDQATRDEKTSLTLAELAAEMDTVMGIQDPKIATEPADKLGARIRAEAKELLKDDFVLPAGGQRSVFGQAAIAKFVELGITLPKGVKVGMTQKAAKAAGGASYHELAPNTVLKGLMRRIDRGTEVTTHDEPKREPVA
jgi:hypothetical protein